MKMKINLKSIGWKIFFLYMSLSLIVISFFSIIIYENQIDLIVDNTILKSRELTGEISDQINLISLKKKYAQKNRSSDLAEEIASVIEKHSRNFMIITTSGTVIKNNGFGDIVSEYDLANAVRAVTARSFSGETYSSDIDSLKNIISFYIPFPTNGIDDNVLVFRKNLASINDRMKELYVKMGSLAVFLAFFHLAVALIFIFIFVKPLAKLHAQSKSISAGNYNVRSDIHSDDEIGELAQAFNKMAESISEKISSLEEYRSKISYELDLAGKVQKSIFPELSSSSKFRFNIFSRPYGQVSGDYYDLFTFDDGSQGFLIADVSGHGVPAALMTMTLKEKFGLYAHSISDPSEMFRKLNEEVCIMFETGDLRPQYFSGFYMIIDSENIMSYCNAGHPHPLLIKKNGQITALEGEGGVVGVFSTMGKYFKTTRIRLEQGDRLILITDGILEAMNNENIQYGWERIIKSVREVSGSAAGDIVARIIYDLEGFAEIEKLNDDATIIGIEVL